MYSVKTLIPLFIVLLSCQSRENLTENTIKVQPSTTTQDTLHQAGESKQLADDNALPDDSTAKQSLVLTSDALQLVDQKTGSSTELPFGMQSGQLIEIVNKVLHSNVLRVGINSECGAGPLKMASWSNGLTLVFQENKPKRQESEGEWQFVGWYMGVVPDSLQKLTTFAGIGIGSTRAEMESAYVIAVSKTSLGYEFSTSSGLYGIFSGSSERARITSLWSGVSCNFR